MAFGSDAPLRPSPSAPRPLLAARRLRHLWGRLGAIYGATWRQAYGSTPQLADSDRLSLVGETWAEGLSGLRDEELAAGIAACLDSTDHWPPTLPEFRMRCLGVADVVALRLELLDPRAARTQFGLLAIERLRGLGWRLHDLRVAERRDAARVIGDAHELAARARLAGVPLPELPIAFLTHEPAPELEAVPAPAARERIAEVTAILTGRRPKPKPSPAPDVDQGHAS